MDSQQQQYCLKWNSFGSNLATSFANLWNSESLADVTLYCEGELKTLLVHVVLVLFFDLPVVFCEYQVLFTKRDSISRSDDKLLNRA